MRKEEREEERERKEPNGREKSRPRVLNAFNTHMSVFVNVSSQHTHIQLKYSAVIKKSSTNVMGRQ